MEQYISALYFSLTTIITIGYGDIRGATTSERICTIVMMVVGAGLYAFNLNDISHIVGNYNILAN